MGGALTLSDNPGGGSIFAFAISLRERADPKRAGPRESAIRSNWRSARAHHRQFAVRGACHRCAPDRSRRQGRPGGRARDRARRPQRAAAAGPRHRRLRAWPGGDHSARAAARAAGAPQEPGFVFAVRAPRFRADVARGLRRLAGEAGARPLAVRAARGGVFAAPPRCAAARAAAGPSAPRADRGRQ